MGTYIENQVPYRKTVQFVISFLTYSMILYVLKTGSNYSARETIKQHVDMYL